MRFAEVKGAIARAVPDGFRAAEKLADNGTWSGDLNNMFADIRVLLGDDTRACMVLLEESEQRLLKALDTVLLDPGTSPVARDAVSRFLPELRTCHQLLRAQARALLQSA